MGRRPQRIVQILSCRAHQDGDVGHDCTLAEERGHLRDEVDAVDGRLEAHARIVLQLMPRVEQGGGGQSLQAGDGGAVGDVSYDVEGSLVVDALRLWQDQRVAARLQQRAREEAPRFGAHQVVVDGRTACGLPREHDTCNVPAECRDVALHPAQRRALVEDAPVARAAALRVARRAQRV